MGKTAEERISAFETHHNVSWSKLAREEIAAGKRWTLLEAAGFLACGDEAIVAQVREWCPPGNALPDPRAAMAASIHLTRELERRRNHDMASLSFEDAVRLLLNHLKEGSITAYVDCKAALLTGHEFREFVYTGGMVGLSPRPKNDARFWESIHVNAAHIRQVRLLLNGATKPAISTVPVSTGAKRGPKPKWDWLNLMGEIVRIADQDGLSFFRSQAHLEEWASDWLARQAGEDAGPAESLVREHIAPIFHAIDRDNERRRGK